MTEQEKAYYMAGYLLNKEAGMLGSLAWEGSKFVPVLGLLPSGIDTAKALGRGNYLDALLEGAGGALATIPGKGTAVKGVTKALQVALKTAKNTPKAAGLAGKAWNYAKVPVAGVHASAPVRYMGSAADEIGKGTAGVVGTVSPRMKEWILKDPRRAGITGLWTGHGLLQTGIDQYRQNRDHRLMYDQARRQYESVYGGGY